MKRLLELKQEKYRLSFSEKRILKKYTIRFPYHKTEKFIIDHILMKSDFVSTESTRDDDGNTVDFKMWINDNGLKVLRENYYESEISARKSDARYKKLTIANAIITIILTMAIVWLTWLQWAKPIQNSELKRLENELTFLKTKYDTLAKYIIDIKTDTVKNKLNIELKKP